MDNKYFVKEKFIYLFSKYSQFTIIKELKFDFNNINENKQKIYLNKNIIFIPKKNTNYIIEDELGLFIAILIIIEIIEETNIKKIKATLIINDKIFKLHNINIKNLLNDSIFLNLCSKLFLYKYFIIKNIVEINSFFFFFKLNPFIYNITESNLFNFFFLNFINYIDFYNLYKTQNINIAINLNYVNKNKNIYVLLSKLEYLECYYFDVNLMRFELNKFEKIYLKYKREYSNYGTLNYFDEFDEYIAFGYVGIYCGFLIIKNEISIYNNLNIDDKSNYKAIQINKNTYDLNFNIVDYTGENDEKYLKLIENYLEFKSFKLIKDNSKQKEYIYFFYKKTPFNQLTYNKENLNENKIYTINTLDCINKKDYKIEYKDQNDIEDYGYDYFFKNK